MCFKCCARSVKKVHGGNLICDVLFVTAAISSYVIDVFLGIEMADADTHRIKQQIYVDVLQERLLQDLKKKTSLESNDNDFIHPRQMFT